MEDPGGVQVGEAHRGGQDIECCGNFKRNIVAGEEGSLQVIMDVLSENTVNESWRQMV